MKISARVHNADRSHRATVTSAGVTQNLAIPAKASGPEARVNGGELFACLGNLLLQRHLPRSCALGRRCVAAPMERWVVGIC